MLKPLVFAILPLTILAAASCKSSKHSHTTRLPGVWQEQPITVDGKNTDWPSPYPSYDEKAQIGYAVSNDKENLYITVETGDPATQIKILKGGLTVWLDKTGNKDEITAINYPIPSIGKKEPEDRAQGMHVDGTGVSAEQKRRMAMNDKVRKLLGEAKDYSLEGFKGCNAQFPILQRDSCGIQVHMDIDMDNELVWEAVVPLKAFYYKGILDKRDAGKPLSISIETTGLPRPPGQSGGGNRGNGGGFRPSVGMGGGMGMRIGGGGGHGGGNKAGAQNNNSMLEPMYKSTKTWKQFGLAVKE